MDYYVHLYYIIEMQKLVADLHKDHFINRMSTNSQDFFSNMIKSKSIN